MKMKLEITKNGVTKDYSKYLIGVMRLFFIALLIYQIYVWNIGGIFLVLLIILVGGIIDKIDKLEDRIKMMEEQNK